ncbi:MAG: TRAP transporter permease, partial [Lachnospiraceae bacterium]|nr:TRAP transporter permease [Lachnospiraceae bacterium]
MAKENLKVNTAPAEDASTGSAADVDAIMKKYDRESNTRIWEGKPKMIIGYLLAAFAVLMLYMNLFANWDERVRRSLFVGIVIILVFLVYPAKKGTTKVNHVPIYDIILMVLGSGAF